MLTRAWTRPLKLSALSPQFAQPYKLLFRGTTDFLTRKGVVSFKQLQNIQSLMKEGEKTFGRDQEMQGALQDLRKVL
jgi:hypothetical protein